VVNIFVGLFQSAIIRQDSLNSKESLGLDNLTGGVAMEAAQFACGLDIADAPFHKVDKSNLPLGGAMDIEMDHRPSVQKDIFDLPISLIGRTEGEKIAESFGFGTDFHGLNGCKKSFVLQA
jgi:hypothetical protein